MVVEQADRNIENSTKEIDNDNTGFLERHSCVQ